MAQQPSGRTRDAAMQARRHEPAGPGSSAVVAPQSEPAEASRESGNSCAPTSLLTPYGPRIALLIAGERFNEKIVDYLRFARAFDASFPGFDTDLHGLVEDDASDRERRHCVDGVRAE